MANQTEPSSPWTIKGMPIEVREMAVRYAKMDDVSVAEWMTRAVKAQANRQDGNDVMPPSKEPATLESALAAIDRGFKVAGMLQALASAKTAGLPVTDAAVKDTVRVLRSTVREGGGMPALKGRQTSRQTGRSIGQTISQEGEDRTNGHSV